MRDVTRRGRDIFVGREQEIATLRSALLEALSGGASLAFVSGEIGIGKSTLVQRVAADAAKQGVRVISGLCYDMETSAPYSPWIDLARLYRPAENEPKIPLEIERMLSGSTPQPPTVAGEIEGFLLELAAKRGLLLILEDLQWADQASLELLRIIVRRFRTEPVAIVATYRDTDLQPRAALYRILPSLIRETRATRLSLLRLDDAELEDLIRSRYDVASGDLNRLVRYVSRYAEGNPFFTEELLHALESDRILIERSTSGWEVEDLATFQMPLLLRQIIDGRLARLAPGTLQALQIAAVIGDDISLPVWQELSGLDTEALSAVVDDAMTSGVLEETPGRQFLRFRHALVREALYDSLVLLRRRVVHEKIGDLLAEDPLPNPDSIAHHYQAAGNPKAAQWLVRAARRSMQAASYLAAASRFEEAISVIQGLPESRGDYAWLLLEISEAYRYVDTPRALSYLDIALERGREYHDQALVTAATWLRGRARALAGENSLDDIDAGLEMYAALSPEDVARIRTSNVGAIVSIGSLAPNLAHFGRHSQAIEAAERYFSAVNSGEFERNPNEHGDAHFALALSYAAFGETERARIEFENTRRRRLETGHHHGVAAAYDWEYVALDKAYFADNPESGRATIRLADEAWLKSDFVHLLEPGIVPHVTEGQILLGDWDEARRRATACLTIPPLRSGSTLILAELDRLQGDQESARSRIRAAIPYGPEIEPSVWLAHNTMEMMRVAAELALDRNDIERAQEWTAAYGRWAEWTGRRASIANHLTLEARVRRAGGNLDAAREAAMQAISVASSPRQPLPLMAAHLLLGEVDTRQGELETAAAHLDAALKIATAADAPYERARCLAAVAQLQLARGASDEANRNAEEAREIARSLGARPLIARLDNLSEEVDAAPIEPEIPGGLTPREIDVLKLVARGLTDAEVGTELHISPRTVGRHLSSIYSKLDVNSRTAATAFAYEHGLAHG